MKYTLPLLMLLVLAMAGTGLAQTNPATADTTALDTSAVIVPPAPVTNLSGRDKPDDNGHAVILTWDLSADDMTLSTGNQSVIQYEVYWWVPNYIDTFHVLQQRYSLIRAALDNWDRWPNQVRNAIQQVESGVTDRDALAFSPRMLPAGEIDSTKADTAAYLLQALRDTLQVMQDVSDGDVKTMYRAIRSEVEEAANRLPQEFEHYPADGRFQPVSEKGFIAPAGTSRFLHSGTKDRFSRDYVPDHADLYYRVDAVTVNPEIRTPSDIFGPVQSSGQLFNDGRTPILIAVLIFTFFTIFFVTQARRGKELYVRPLAGIEAVDEAIGRATEMGKPILYVLGLGVASDIATIASFTILSRVAKRVAEYQTELIVPTYDPIVMTVAQEVVKSAYMDAGRPDDYNEDIVYFVTQSQFAYVAAVNGVMLRQLPATNVYMGKFYAESLILAETGAVAGSIQIAGTDEIAQLPFFVVACDYTLIGEELYAASAYLEGEPILLGSLKAQDYGKALFVISAIIGFITMIFGWHGFKDLFEVTN